MHGKSEFQVGVKHCNSIAKASKGKLPGFSFSKMLIVIYNLIIILYSLCSEFLVLSSLVIL